MYDNFLLFQDVDEILKFIEGGKEGTKRERNKGGKQKERQRRDSGKREERIQRVAAASSKITATAGALFSDETLMSMQPNKTYIDPNNHHIGDVRKSRIGSNDENSSDRPSRADPKERANVELKKSGIEIDESEIDNGIITVTCHKASALAAAQQAIKELEELRADEKSKSAVSGKAVSSKTNDAPTDKCVGHDHEHHGEKGGKVNKKDLNKKSGGGGIERVREGEKIVEKVTVPDKVVDIVNHFKAYGAVPDRVYISNKGSEGNASNKVKIHDKPEEGKTTEKLDLPDKVANLSNRFKTYGDALDYVYRDTLSSKKKDDDDMSDSEDCNVENKKEKLARLSTVLRNHKGNLNKSPSDETPKDHRPKLKAERKADTNKAIAIDVHESVSAAAPVYRVCKASELKVIGNAESVVARRASSSTDLKAGNGTSGTGTSGTAKEQQHCGPRKGCCGHKNDGDADEKDDCCEDDDDEGCEDKKCSTPCMESGTSKDDLCCCCSHKGWVHQSSLSDFNSDSCHIS